MHARMCCSVKCWRCLQGQHNTFCKYPVGWVLYALCVACQMGIWTEKRTTGQKNKKRIDNASFKSMQSRQTFSQDEPQARPFLNQLFIWIGLDAPVICLLSVSSHLCPCVCMWMVLEWYVSHSLLWTLQSTDCSSWFLGRVLINPEWYLKVCGRWFKGYKSIILIFSTGFNTF